MRRYLLHVTTVVVVAASAVVTISGVFGQEVFLGRVVPGIVAIACVSGLGNLFYRRGRRDRGDE